MSGAQSLCSSISSEVGFVSPAAERCPRILHLINHFELGGTECQAVLLLQHLDRTRYDVRLAALSTSGPLFEKVAPLYSHIERYPLTCFYNFNALKQIARLRSFLRANSIRIVHTHEFYSGILAVMAAQFTDAQVITSQRNLRMSDRLVHVWGRRVLNALADRILVNAEAIKNDIVSVSSVSPAKVIVIKNGLASPLRGKEWGDLPTVLSAAKVMLTGELGIPISSTIVGMVANLRPVKGHQYLIDAAARVLRVHPHAHFVLIGEGELRDALARQAKDLGIENRVHFMGHRKDAGSLVAGFDVAVLASLHEGLPNTVLEAMAAGVPVVATAVGGVTEIIEDGKTGYLVRPANPDAMAERLKYMLEHGRLRQEIALRGQRSVRDRFGIEYMVKSVQDLYEAMLNEKNIGMRKIEPKL